MEWRDFIQNVIMVCMVVAILFGVAYCSMSSENSYHNIYKTCREMSTTVEEYTACRNGVN